MSTADIVPDILKVLNAFFREGLLRSSHWRHGLLEERQLIGHGLSFIIAQNQ